MWRWPRLRRRCCRRCASTRLALRCSNSSRLAPRLAPRASLLVRSAAAAQRNRVGGRQRYPLPTHGDRLWGPRRLRPVLPREVVFTVVRPCNGRPVLRAGRRLGNASAAPADAVQARRARATRRSRRKIAQAAFSKRGARLSLCMWMMSVPKYGRCGISDVRLPPHAHSRTAVADGTKISTTDCRDQGAHAWLRSRVQLAAGLFPHASSRAKRLVHVFGSRAGSASSNRDHARAVRRRCEDAALHRVVSTGEPCLERVGANAPESRATTARAIAATAAGSAHEDGREAVTSAVMRGAAGKSATFACSVREGADPRLHAGGSSLRPGCGDYRIINSSTGVAQLVRARGHHVVGVQSHRRHHLLEIGWWKS